jgi:hypothetical protein
MLEQAQKQTARLCATIEEELGGFRQLADLPSIEIEEIAARIVRAIEPLIAAADGREPASRAA